MFAPRHDLTNYDRWKALLELSIALWSSMCFWAAPVFELAVLEYNEKANWQEWLVCMTFGFCAGGILPGLFPEGWTFWIYLLWHFSLVLSGVLGLFSITYPAIYPLGYFAFFSTGFAFSGLYIIIVNLVVPLFPDHPGRTLAVLYGIFSIGIIVSPQIGKRYVLIFSPPWAWAAHIFTWSAAGIFAWPRIYSWTKKFHGASSGAATEVTVPAAKQEKEMLVLATVELTNAENIPDTTFYESGSISCSTIKSQYTFTEGLSEAKTSFITLIRNISFWQIFLSVFAFGCCLPPASVFQVTMKEYFGLNAQESSDIYTIINSISPIPRICTSLAIDLVRCSRFPYGAKNVTVIIFTFGIGVGFMMRFLAWESQTIFVLGMVYIYFCWNSFPPLVAVLSTEAFGAGGKKALGVLFFGFSPGALVGAKVESAIGIVQYYNYFAIVWVFAVINTSLISMKGQHNTEKS